MGAPAHPSFRVHSLLAGSGTAADHLEREPEPRQVLSRMVVRISQLGQTVVVRPGLLALVDRRIKIDEVPARLPGRLHDDLDIALAVEGAGVAAGSIVVNHSVDVGGFAPAHAFEVDSEGRTRGTARDVE